MNRVQKLLFGGSGKPARRGRQPPPASMELDDADLVGVSDSGEILAGEEARNQWLLHPDRTGAAACGACARARGR